MVSPMVVHCERRSAAFSSSGVGSSGAVPSEMQAVSAKESKAIFSSVINK